MDKFGALRARRARRASRPRRTATRAQYIADLAARVLAQRARPARAPDEEALAWPATSATSSAGRDPGIARQVQRALRRLVLRAHACTRDRPTAAQPVDEAVDRLRAQGHVFDEDGAVWVRTTDFGDDKDRVIRRANGIHTYFAADAAYYLNKGDRGFAHKIYLLGADHHGYVHRLKALAGAAGRRPREATSRC